MAERHGAHLRRRGRFTISADATLLDGTSIKIDVARDDDVEAVLAFTRALSPASRHERFFACLGDEAIEQEIRRELHDGGSLSLLARSKVDGLILGHAYAALVTQDRAELAFAVADEARNNGVGTELLGALLAALRVRSVHHFQATTSAENHTMRGVLAASGFTIVADARLVRATLDDAEAATP